MFDQKLIWIGKLKKKHKKFFLKETPDDFSKKPVCEVFRGKKMIT
jgi:hypothetical protein